MTASIPKSEVPVLNCLIRSDCLLTRPCYQAPVFDATAGYKRNNGIIHLKNKTPVWNEGTDSEYATTELCGMPGISLLLFF